MAQRPVFIPEPDGALVRERLFAFLWHPGMAPSQKMKNVVELHHSAAEKGLLPILEVSTKSQAKLGQRLSAFNLKVALKDGHEIPLECVFQGSKVFEFGGPFLDLYFAEPRDAKRDSRLTSSGRLIGFKFEERDFPLSPKTGFYDWLFLRSLFKHREYLKKLHYYAGFSDIEFNPEKSINCQARSCALFVSLQKLNLLEEVVNFPEKLLEVVARQEREGRSHIDPQSSFL